MPSRQPHAFGASGSRASVAEVATRRTRRTKRHQGRRAVGRRGSVDAGSSPVTGQRRLMNTVAAGPVQHRPAAALAVDALASLWASTRRAGISQQRLQQPCFDPAAQWCGGSRARRGGAGRDPSSLRGFDQAASRPAQAAGGGWVEAVPVLLSAGEAVSARAMAFVFSWSDALRTASRCAVRPRRGRGASCAERASGHFTQPAVALGPCPFVLLSVRRPCPCCRVMHIGWLLRQLPLFLMAAADRSKTDKN